MAKRNVQLLTMGCETHFYHISDITDIKSVNEIVTSAGWTD